LQIIEQMLKNDSWKNVIFVKISAEGRFDHLIIFLIFNLFNSRP